MDGADKVTHEEPNVLALAPKLPGTFLGSVRKAQTADTFEAEKISFACVTDQEGKTVSTPRSRRQDLKGFTDLRALGFTVTKAGEDDKLSQDVSLILDNFGYIANTN
ncbi:hypothetical protein CNMCM5623_006488 [Aspergillus felis]|uniref:Uncharacterized protein n=1 Tax=Aspergillus felis TaxID=1287682 RepID=A0A8H6PVR5_9EURO|nr:hypothetical protein CNMCM5623_006488 [Aspergillus felis]KAF7178152.1 hypothetical protein CNMCM7691_006817 [Aspergillus felis]